MGGPELTIIGNGTPDEAAAFHEGLLESEVKLLTDPDLTSYKAMVLKRSLFAVSQPRTYLRGFQVSLRGFRSARLQGDSLQQGEPLSSLPITMCLLPFLKAAR